MSSQNPIITPLTVTAVFNTGIALVLHVMVIQDSSFRDVWVISQLTGLSICLCVRQAQIEPHFLFNTLSNAISLMDTDPDKARQMLMDLNEYLKISLQRTRQEMVTLSRELDLVRRYLTIFQVRMGSRLAFEITDHTGMPDLPFPPMPHHFGIPPDLPVKHNCNIPVTPSQHKCPIVVRN